MRKWFKQLLERLFKRRPIQSETDEDEDLAQTRVLSPYEIKKLEEMMSEEDSEDTDIDDWDDVSDWTGDK